MALRAALCATALAAAAAQNNSCSAAAPSFYTSSHAALLLNGSIVTWAAFEGRVLALTNVASF